MNDEHVHKWKLPEGGFMVIDTFPPQYPYECACGAFTHSPETGEPCATCAGNDYRRRTTNLVRLEGGRLDGKWVPRPLNQTVNFRIDAMEKSVQLFTTYKATDDPLVWEFYSNDWTVPVVERDAP